MMLDVLKFGAFVLHGTRRLGGVDIPSHYPSRGCEHPEDARLEEDEK